MGLETDNHIPLSLCGELPEIIARKPLVQLPFKKQAEEFQEVGLSTLGEAIDRTVSGTLGIRRDCFAFSTFSKILFDIEKTIKDADQARPFWLRYAKHAGLTVLPETEICCATDFLSWLSETLDRTVDINSKRKNITGVFRLRTSQPKGKRPTLDAAGKELGTSGSRVKELETLLVTLLHSQLIDRDFTRSGAFSQRISEILEGSPTGLR